ncbi:AMM_1a_G0027490.mRNA.1.CDS.1 [Saccharomyces cerevisiae]|nr:AMM_1a_G0027490.mRNA.1.CDS.1 [Saccharomyces cerevisiae]CAI6721020.1 AMM_1a_G0027490.mRNA.1.CDS.1 [Saccharomyces cerevisiae]
MAHLTYFLRPFQLCLEKFVTSVWLSRSAYLGFCIECIVSIKYSKFLLPRLLTRESRKTTLIQKLFWYFQCECAGECFFFVFFWLNSRYTLDSSNLYMNICRSQCFQTVYYSLSYLAVFFFFEILCFCYCWKWTS